MNSDRIKEIQETTAYPESVSVKQALLQVWNECEQEQVKNCNIPHVSLSVCSHPDKYLETVMGPGLICRKCNTYIKAN